MPPKFRTTLFHNFTCTIEKPPGGGATLVLSNTKTGALFNDNLTVFPPVGAVFKLLEPMHFARVGTPDKVVATIETMYFTMTHNP